VATLVYDDVRTIADMNGTLIRPALCNNQVNSETTWTFPLYIPLHDTSQTKARNTLCLLKHNNFDNHNAPHHQNRTRHPPRLLPPRLHHHALPPSSLDTATRAPTSAERRTGNLRETTRKLHGSLQHPSHSRRSSRTLQRPPSNRQRRERSRFRAPLPSGRGSARTAYSARARLCEW
jgi:hypothetical protein